MRAYQSQIGVPPRQDKWEKNGSERARLRLGSPSISLVTLFCTRLFWPFSHQNYHLALCLNLHDTAIPEASVDVGLASEACPRMIAGELCGYVPSCRTGGPGENRLHFQSSAIDPLDNLLSYLFLCLHREQLWRLSLQTLSNWKTGLQICDFFFSKGFFPPLFHRKEKE